MSHWLPRQGEPDSLPEQLIQFVIRALAHLPVYIAVVTTLTLVMVALAR